MYDKEITRVLCAAGKGGLSVHKIALHVHGACSTFFEPLDIVDVQREVASWLLRNSRGTHALVERTARRGVYRLNTSCNEVRQLLMDFGEEH